MAGMHRTRSRRRFSVALVSAATATATALTVGVEPPPEPAKRVVDQKVDLAAAIQLLPNTTIKCSTSPAALARRSTTSNDFSPKGDKPTDKPGHTGDKVNEAAGAATAGTSDATPSDKAA